MGTDDGAVGDEPRTWPPRVWETSTSTLATSVLGPAVGTRFRAGARRRTVVGMLAHEEHGTGTPLLLIHGTPSSRREWLAAIEPLSEHRRVIAIDLPGFGESPPLDGAVLPADWVAPIRATLAALGIDRCAVVGSSMGGWTALELAKADCATAALALSPAGLWAKRSPLVVNAQLRIGRAVGKLTPTPVTKWVLNRPVGRKLALRSLTVDGSRIPFEWADALIEGSFAATGWPEHYHAAKRTRFTGGSDIAAPVRVIWGDRDPVAPAAKSRHTGELPAHTVVETWPNCAHSLLWDARERVIAAALELA